MADNGQPPPEEMQKMVLEQAARESRELDANRLRAVESVTGGYKRLVLDFHPVSGDFRMAGPVSSRAICYIMLELARDSIYDYAHQQGQTAKAGQAGGLVQVQGWQAHGPKAVD